VADVDNKVGAQDLAGAATEEAADFARVAAMVGSEDAQPGATVPEAVQEAPKMDAAESMAGLLVAASSVAAYSGMKNVAALWTPETCATCAERVVPVLRKYPWGARIIDFFETGAGVEEMALGAFLLPMGFATWQAVKADMGGEEKAEAGQVLVNPEKTATVDAPAGLGGLVEVHGRAN